MSAEFREDTIAAIATALGEGSVGIVRVSGPDAFDVVDRMYRGRVKLCAVDSHTVNYGYIVNPLNDERVDEVLVIVMRSPRSYTREDVVEIHGHGGTMVVQEVLRAALACGARLAEAGEFTKRAFLNGRIDLSQAEAVSSLIQAETEEARKASLRPVAG